MNARMIIKQAALAGLIVLVGLWLRGHDVLTAVALLVLVAVVAIKVAYAIRFRRRTDPPSGLGSGDWPAGSPVPRPPSGRPPELSAVAEIES